MSPQIGTVFAFYGLHIQPLITFRLSTMKSLICVPTPYVMKSYTICLAFLCFTLGLQAQAVLKTIAGSASFKSTAPLELIQASSNKVSCSLRPTDRGFAFLCPIQSFVGFNSGLQRQHFNDNYMQSAKYPNGTFSGRIIEEVDLTKPGTYNVRAKGVLDVHGVKQERIIRATVVVTPSNVRVTARFTVPLKDHKITIPTIVSQKIAEVIDVSFEANLK